MDDDKIINLYLNRDESAISHTREKYGKKLFAVSFRITVDRQTAEECENDTYLESWNRIPPAEPRGYFPAFLSRIVRNISINRCMEKERLKRKAFITELSEEMEQCIPSSSDVESEIDGMELGMRISDFLYEQSRIKRIIFVRRYYYLDSVKQISDALGCSESKVKTQLFRMRNDLKAYLEKEGYEL
jgi:RNA polymerase sigma-70 factor (ECF subfamily)